MNKLQEKKIYLGIDYGTKRIGLAIAQEGENIAKTFKIIHKFNELNDIIPAKSINHIVLGYPLQPDGSAGETCAKVKNFAEKLSTTFHLPIDFVDERLTSKRAEEFLRDGLCMRPQKRKEILDAESARIILQMFLDCRQK